MNNRKLEINRYMAFKQSLLKMVTLNGEPRTCELLQDLVIKALQTILGEAVRPFAY